MRDTGREAIFDGAQKLGRLSLGLESCSVVTACACGRCLVDAG